MEIEGRIVVVDALDGLHVLAGSGAAVWPMFDGTVTLASLADDIAEVFGQDRGSVLEDLRYFAIDAALAGLIEAAGGEGGL